MLCVDVSAMRSFMPLKCRKIIILLSRFVRRKVPSKNYEGVYWYQYTLYIPLYIIYTIVTKATTMLFSMKSNTTHNNTIYSTLEA